MESTDGSLALRKNNLFFRSRRLSRSGGDHWGKSPGENYRGSSPAEITGGKSLIPIVSICRVIVQCSAFNYILRDKKDHAMPGSCEKPSQRVRSTRYAA